MRGIANRFVDRMGALDVMTIISINKGQAVSTTDKKVLKTAIERFQPASRETIRSSRQDTEHILRMIGELAAQMSEAPQRRKVMAIIGNPQVFNPQRATVNLDDSLSPFWFDAVRDTARHNISIYNIDPHGLTEHLYPADYATSFAAETGGWAWSNTNNYGGVVEQIWREAGSYYVLGYVAPIADGKLHDISVKVNVKGATVRARRGRG